MGTAGPVRRAGTLTGATKRAPSSAGPTGRHPDGSRAEFLLGSKTYGNSRRSAGYRGRGEGLGTDPACRRIRSARPRRRASPAGPHALPSRAAGGDRAAARRRAPAPRRPDRRRQEPRLPAPRHAARRNHAGHLAAHLAHAGPGPRPRGARRRRHVPRLDPRCGRDAPAPRPARDRPAGARLRRARAARLSGVPGAPARPGLPAGRRGRGPLHQRVGPRLPAGVPRAGTGPRGARPRRASSPAPPPRPRSSATRSWPGSVCRPTRPRSSRASPAPTWRSGPPRSMADASARDGWTHSWPRRSSGAARAAGPPSCTRRRGGRPTPRPRASRPPGGRRPPITPGSTGRGATPSSRPSPGRTGDRRRHQRLRHGHRSARRARRRPPDPARLHRGLLPGGRASRAGRAAGDRAAPDGARRHRAPATPPRAPGRRRRHGPDGARPQVGHVPGAAPVGGGRELPARRHSSLLRGRGGDARRLRALRRVPGAPRRASRPIPPRRR